MNDNNIILVEMYRKQAEEREAYEAAKECRMRKICEDEYWSFVDWNRRGRQSGAPLQLCWHLDRDDH